MLYFTFSGIIETKAKTNNALNKVSKNIPCLIILNDSIKNHLYTQHNLLISYFESLNLMKKVFIEIQVFQPLIFLVNLKFLTLDQDEEGNFYVEGIKVILKDVMGTNGVIHIIDDVIIPETAKSVSEALQQKGRHTLKELFDLAGINEDSGLSNVTIFGPSEEVIRKMECFDTH